MKYNEVIPPDCQPGVVKCSRLPVSVMSRCAGRSSSVLPLGGQYLSLAPPDRLSAAMFPGGETRDRVISVYFRQSSHCESPGPHGAQPHCQWCWCGAAASQPAGQDSSCDVCRPRSGPDQNEGPGWRRGGGRGGPGEAGPGAAAGGAGVRLLETSDPPAWPPAGLQSHVLHHFRSLLVKLLCWLLPLSRLRGWRG